jgi:hypothetical protein
VRFGGSPYFYNWYRWGYGWSYLRNDRGKYQALTEDELQQVKRLTENILQEIRVIIAKLIIVIEVVN